MTGRRCEAREAEFRATVMKLTEADAVLALIDRFFDPKIAINATRSAVFSDDSRVAEAA